MYRPHYQDVSDSVSHFVRTMETLCNHGFLKVVGSGGLQLSQWAVISKVALEPFITVVNSLENDDIFSGSFDMCFREDWVNDFHCEPVLNDTYRFHVGENIAVDAYLTKREEYFGVDFCVYQGQFEPVDTGQRWRSSRRLCRFIFFTSDRGYIADFSLSLSEFNSDQLTTEINLNAMSIYEVELSFNTSGFRLKPGGVIQLIETWSDRNDDEEPSLTNKTALARWMNFFDNHILLHK